MRRALALATLLCLLALPAAAVGQSNPFGPLPPAAPPTPEPTAAPNPADQSSVSRPLLLGIAGGVAVLFIGIGFYIARDARRNLTDSDRQKLEHQRERTEQQRRDAERAKQKARARSKAQRQARKKQRR
jgi:hypothetical protein